MAAIQKARETMTAKQRVLKTFAFEKTDRVTIGYDGNAGVTGRLYAALGLRQGDDEGFRQALGIDYVPIDARYTGPELFSAPEGRRVDRLDGYFTRWVEHETGGYWDYCDFPLQAAEDETFYAYPVPNPDHFDYEAALDQAKAYGDRYALYIGGAGTPDLINSNGRLMGMEDILCHMILKNEAAMHLVHRRADFLLGKLERLLDKCKGRIDFMWLGEDLGTQIAPMISLGLYREILRPIHKKFADLASAYGIPSQIHTCGCSSWAYEDFIEIGIKGVDSLQPEAVNMSPEYLVGRFGGRLNFRGLISTAGPLAYGTAEETRAACVKTLATMMPARGYHFAPSHCVQDNSPVENVIAMYQAAHTYGVY